MTKSLQLTILVLLLACLPLPVFADAAKGVSGSMVVHAPKEAVWNVISDMGHFDDRLISRDGDDAVVEQKFKTLPLLGEIVVTIKAKVQAMRRIDFSMVKADHIKDLSGAWSLSPINEEKTQLGLTMHVDPGLPVPRFLVNQFVAGRVRSRLKKVKALAEKAGQKEKPRLSAAAR